MERKTHIYSNFSLSAERRLANKHSFPERQPGKENASAYPKENDPKKEAENRKKEAEKQAELLRINKLNEVFSSVVDELNKDKPNAQIVYNQLKEINNIVRSIFDKYKNKMSPSDFIKKLQERIDFANKGLPNKPDYHLVLTSPGSEVVIDPEFLDVPGYDGEFDRVLAPLELKTKAWGQIYEVRDILKNGNTENAKALLIEMKDMEKKVKDLKVDIAEDSAFQKALTALKEVVVKEEKKDKSKRINEGEDRVVSKKRPRKKSKKNGFKYGEIINDVNEKSKEYSNEILKKGSQLWENVKSRAKTAGESAKKFVDGMNDHKAEPVPTPDFTSEAPKPKPKVPLPPKPEPVSEPLAPEPVSEEETYNSDLESSKEVNNLLSGLAKELDVGSISLDEKISKNDYDKITKAIPKIREGIENQGNDPRFLLEKDIPIVITNSDEKTGLIPYKIYGENTIGINYLQSVDEITETITQSVAQIDETNADLNKKYKA